MVFFGHIWRRHGAKYFCSRKAVAMFFGLPCRSRCGGCYASSFALHLFLQRALVSCLCASEVPRWWLASVLLIYKGCGYLQVLLLSASTSTRTRAVFTETNGNARLPKWAWHLDLRSKRSFFLGFCFCLAFLVSFYFVSAPPFLLVVIAVRFFGLVLVYLVLLLPDRVFVPFASC